MSLTDPSPDDQLLAATSPAPGPATRTCPICGGAGYTEECDSSASLAPCEVGCQECEGTGEVLEEDDDAE